MNRARALTPSEYGLYAFVICIWSTSWIGMRWQVGVVAPEVSVVWRFMIAGAAMFALAFLRRAPLRYGAADHLRFAGMGMMMFSSNFMFFYHATTMIPSGLVSVVFSLTAIVNLLLAALLFGQRITPRGALGAAMGFAGIALMFAPQIAGLTFNRDSALGLVLSLCGTLCFCSGNLFSGDSQRRGISVLSACAWAMSYGALWAAAVALLLGRPFTVEWTWLYWSALIYLALLASVATFYAYLTLLGRIGAGRAGYATVLIPVLALMISTLFENYHWSAISALGAALALGGNLLVMRRSI